MTEGGTRKHSVHAKSEKSFETVFMLFILCFIVLNFFPRNIDLGNIYIKQTWKGIKLDLYQGKPYDL